MAARRDADSRSQVSSFYGRPSSNMEGTSRRQHADPVPVNRRDSTSSFFRPDEYGEDNNRRGGGYDRMSSYGMDARGDLGTGGKDEEWDVYADFNNAGPRYAGPLQQDDGYRAIREGGSEATAANQVELVTVPALGAEWKASELRDMTKAGRAEARAEERRRKWREFNRDQRGLCGIHWATRKILVIGAFGLCAVIGILLAVFIPRVPGFGFLGDAPLNATSDGGNAQFSRTPANFSFDAMISLQEGDLGGYTVPAKAYTPIQVPVTFSYAAANSSDITWLNFYNACKNKSQVTGGIRPALQLRLVLEMSIAGLIGKPTAGTQIADAACPIELPSSAG